MNSIIGAVTYLPYFKLAIPGGDNSTIDSSSFFMKAKAALSYYDHSLFGNKSLNAFYYLGDNSNNNYDNHDGKAEQMNNAHFMELAGALSILDFMKLADKQVTSDGKVYETLYKEYGIENDTRNIKLKDLGSQTKSEIAVPLSKLMLFSKFIDKSLTRSLDSKDAWHKVIDKEKKFFNSGDFYNGDFTSYLNYFKEWVDEMEDNDVSFSPFHNNQRDKSLLNFINGYQVKNTFGSNKASDKRLTELLNKNSRSVTEGKPIENFLNVFDKSTEKVVNDILT